MKRIFISLAATCALFAFAACSNNANNQPAEQAANDAATNTATETSSVMVPGKLNFVNVKEGEQPVLRALALVGNRAGSSDFNKTETATEGIRCIFELNEWIEFYPETDADYGIKVWIIKHKDDQSYYLKNKIRDLTPGFVQLGELYNDPDAEEGSPWCSLYVNPEDAEPGLYDFVFTYQDEVFATMLIQFFKEGELDKLSDEELANKMAK